MEHRVKPIISGGSDSVCYLWDIVPQSNPEGSSANADAFQALVGSDGEAAYKAYMQLSQEPEAALELLEEQLSELVGQEYDDKQVTKWIVGLGSDSIQQKAKAASKLLEFGPAVYDQLSKSLEGKLTDAKRESLTQIPQSNPSLLPKSNRASGGTGNSKGRQRDRRLAQEKQNENVEADGVRGEEESKKINQDRRRRSENAVDAVFMSLPSFGYASEISSLQTV